jgi:hypothetical protein
MKLKLNFLCTLCKKVKIDKRLNYYNLNIAVDQSKCCCWLYIAYTWLRGVYKKDKHQMLCLHSELPPFSPYLIQSG